MSQSNDEPRKLTPFKMITRGKDTVDPDDDITFVDFSPQVLPADAPEEPVEVVVPKEGSAVESADSEVSPLASEPSTSTSPVLTPAAPVDGPPKKPAGSKPSSSSSPKTG